MSKKFNTIQEQINKLKRRGLIISDEKFAQEVLEKENYYKLVNGYKELFIGTSATPTEDEKYKKDASFVELYILYEFDREIRNLFIKFFLKIENHIKTTIAYDFSSKYGHDNYLIIDNFNCTPKNKRQTPEQRIGEITDLIAGVQRNTAKQLQKCNPMLSHYSLTYGYIPLWVLINTLTLGTINRFYSILKDADKNDVAKQFNIRPNELRSILSTLNIFRNAAAHDERFYNLKSVRKNGVDFKIPDTNMHRALNIPKDNSGNYQCGKKDLFSMVIVIKLMLDKKDIGYFANKFSEELDFTSSLLSSISKNDILNSMGFPQNWEEIRDI